MILAIFLGQSECKKCRAGQYSNNIFLGHSECKKCRAGQYSSNIFLGQSECKECRAGQYSNNTASAQCEPCAAGTYQNSTGQSSCHECDRGSFQNATGNLSNPGNDAEKDRFDICDPRSCTLSKLYWVSGFSFWTLCYWSSIFQIVRIARPVLLATILTLRVLQSARPVLLARTKVLGSPQPIE